ncbi:aerobic-type carbon monoxide dehydrogenase, small subunit CoxS/CutS-like protein [Sphaerochaeta pleomorpha str. Grapes]|uniref:Aerobic-type carbon monoxide dehydrogenase, small subunit CoxS/CutS-like protein n=1 Tax=Sphaerochaeta pleomorpha (strain ATCC BAA-1885 / DSM 22778 / Grapes) TaxID=158190 RepID=G8QQH0_SPHPG|nr:(2Fe-2S)-binding protein [Sphaerochaeta pleomorpha]AEV30900.1 aerobic-type carbon monoxide dehydrogenase, small subunit CoxS/CutS-like protein [Sphaerochaeta pleomorpha str. Grapes]
METNIEFTLNGELVSITTDPLRRLLDVIREDFGLVGTKEGCGEGECGACSVIKDGRIITTCMVPIGAVGGSSIMTIDGLKETAQGKCIIEAFADGGAVQCGFCIPGMVIAAEDMLTRNPHPSEQEIRAGISGNICRCTGYDLIVESIKLASERGNGLW